jgi:hypothetical protein
VASGVTNLGWMINRDFMRSLLVFMSVLDVMVRPNAPVNAKGHYKFYMICAGKKEEEDRERETGRKGRVGFTDIIQTCALR